MSVLTTVLAMGVGNLVWSSTQSVLATCFAIIAATSSPFFALTMVLIRRLVEVQDDILGMATTDVLTGLKNRAFFVQQADAHDAGQVLILEIDNFNGMNSRLGRDFGDRILVAVGEHLKESLRRSDTIARLEDDRFAVYMQDATPATAEDAGNRLVAGFSMTYADTDDLHITLSAGLVTSSQKLSASEVLGCADMALYAAKSAGRASLRIWDETQKRPTTSFQPT